mgnify:CR=1
MGEWRGVITSVLDGSSSGISL